MKYVALLSGGKDSCYNLLHCSENGHELIAAASLGPEDGKEELDSYLYQTVGQDAIEFVACALGVPLYRKVISGAALEQGLEYGTRNAKAGGVLGDETEDLYTLLLTVKLRHPGIQGVSVGAILSNYQRVRVEHVCNRLSLTPLSYLWQRDQAELLSEMIEAGMKAVLIKVAGIGLTPKHLGKTLAEMQPTLIKLNDLYGSHICGEGGEYETLTLDCPMFESSIKLTETENVIHSDNDFATVAFLRIKDATLEPKHELEFNCVQVPSLLDDDFFSVRDAILQSQQLAIDSTGYQVDSITNTELRIPNASSRRLGSWVAVNDVRRELEEIPAGITIEAEVEECLQRLQDRLAEFNLTLSHCANINIFLSSMDLFSRVNAVYKTYFGISPPARACVGVDLPPNIQVKLDCIAFAEQAPTDRQALHVQSLSYWAPANIGPYSQAIVADERISISGQIGLIPSSLTLPSPTSLAFETALSFQHVERVTMALKASSGGGWNGYAQTVIYWLAKSSDIIHVKQACQAYEKDAGSPTLFVAVKSLPKNALVEKQVLLHTGRCLVADDDDGELTLQCRVPVTEKGVISECGILVNWQVSYFHDAEASCAIMCVQGEGDYHMVSAKLKALLVLSRFWACTLSIRLFYRPSRTDSFELLCQDLFTSNGKPPITSIPCRFISTREADDWDYAICILGN